MAFKRIFILISIIFIPIKSADYLEYFKKMTYTKKSKIIAATALAGYATWRVCKIYSSQPTVNNVPQIQKDKNFGNLPLEQYYMLLGLHPKSQHQTDSEKEAEEELTKQKLDAEQKIKDQQKKDNEDKNKKKSEQTPAEAQVDNVIDKEKTDKEKKSEDNPISKSQEELNSEKVSPEKIDNVLRKIQSLDAIFIQKSFSELAKYLEIDLTEYDTSGPLLFEQLFLENFLKLKKEIQEFKKAILQISDQEVKRIQLNRLFNVNIAINNLFMVGPWHQGYLILKDLLINNSSLNEYKKTWQDHWQNNMSLVWAFYHMAINEGKKFNEGTFNIENKELLDFLISYQYTYDRSGALKSSHYKEINKKRYGSNIPEKDRNKYSFPNNKAHILFGNIHCKEYMPERLLIDSNLGKYLEDTKLFPNTINELIAQFATETNEPTIFFLKPETYPTENPESPSSHGFNDLVCHGYEFAVATGRKFGVGSDDAPNMKKERIPKQILKAWENFLYKYFPKDTNLINQILNNPILNKVYDQRNENTKKFEHYYSEVEKFGIKAIILFLKEKQFKPTTDSQNKAYNDLDALLKQYDENEIRKGSEITLTKEKLHKYLLKMDETIKYNNSEKLFEFFIGDIN